MISNIFKVVSLFTMLLGFSISNAYAACERGEDLIAKAISGPESQRLEMLDESLAYCDSYRGWYLKGVVLKSQKKYD
jgi:hypothetical protein